MIANRAKKSFSRGSFWRVGRVIGNKNFFFFGLTEPAKIPPVLTDPSESPVLLALPEASPSPESLDSLQLESNIDIPEASHDLTPHQLSGDMSTNITQSSARPKRQTKRPKYLDDYVL